MGGGPVSGSDNANALPRQQKRVAVIGGGGASGLATLRAFLERAELNGDDPSWEIQAYERRHDIGGVWLPAPATPQPSLPSSESAIRLSQSVSIVLSRQPKYPQSPLYDSVTTNVPHPLMAFHEFSFPPETPLYPPASYICNYLHDFAKKYNLRKHVEFNAEVQDLRWDEKSSKWFIRVGSLNLPHLKLEPELGLKRQREEVFDAVVVANGHFGIPHIPAIPGVDEWRASTNRGMMHSMWYREPSIMKDLVVLVVGGGASGKDMILEALSVGLMVIHSTSNGIYVNDDRIRKRARLVELSVKDGKAIYEDGTTDSGIEFVLLATGYDLGFPFFKNLKKERPSPQALPDHLALSVFSVHPLAQHTFPLRTYSPHTLAFVGILRATSIFPALDSQAQAVATVMLGGPDIWDQAREEASVVNRFLCLSKHCDGDPELIASNWHKISVPGLSDPTFGTWQSLREDLLALGRCSKWRIQDWEEEFFPLIGLIQEEWKLLVKTGVSDEWLKGVGVNGIEDWVQLMRKVLDHRKSRGLNKEAQDLDILDYGELPSI